MSASQLSNYSPLLAPTTSKGALHSSSAMRQKNRKALLLGGCCVFGFVIVVYGFYMIRKIPEFSQYDLVRSYANYSSLPSDSDRPRTILFWNTFFGDARWSLPEDTLGPDYLRDDLQCPVYNCHLTNVREYLPAVDMYDAVIFHTAQPFPFLNSLPSVRGPHQLYVFAQMEPPGETKHVLSDETAFYNLTMTYRLDSDIVWPYKYIVDIGSGLPVAPRKHPQWRAQPSAWNDTTISDLWPQKRKGVAWFVSHCETLSRREKLAEQLGKYIDVDIYGKCGPLSCARHSTECDTMLDNQYKFYLSFENSLCTDYVSEKLYNALERQIIPVVFGGADYNRFLPPNSYINAESFETVEQLGSYLNYLSENPSEYMQYFWWRSVYRLGYRSPFCDLCERLHSSSNYVQKMQVYSDIEKWWLQDSCWFESKIAF